MGKQTNREVGMKVIRDMPIGESCWLQDLAKLARLTSREMASFLRECKGTVEKEVVYTGGHGLCVYRRAYRKKKA